MAIGFNHSLIAFGTHSTQPFATINWFLQLGMKVGHYRKPYLQINSTQAIFRAIKTGLGIGTLTQEHVEREGAQLHRILPKFKGPIVESYYAYPKQLIHSKRVQAFGDFIKEVMLEKSAYASEILLLLLLL